MGSSRAKVAATLFGTANYPQVWISRQFNADEQITGSLDVIFEHWEDETIPIVAHEPTRVVSRTLLHAGDERAVFAFVAQATLTVAEHVLWGRIPGPYAEAIEEALWGARAFGVCIADAIVDDDIVYEGQEVTR